MIVNIYNVHAYIGFGWSNGVILALLQPTSDVIVIPTPDSYDGIDEYGALNAYTLALILTFCVCIIIVFFCYLQRMKYSLPYYTHKDRELSATVPRHSGHYRGVLVDEDMEDGTSLTETLITTRNTHANSHRTATTDSPEVPGSGSGSVYGMEEIPSEIQGMGSFATTPSTCKSSSKIPKPTTTTNTNTTSTHAPNIIFPRTNTNTSTTSGVTAGTATNNNTQTLTNQFYTISPTKRL